MGGKKRERERARKGKEREKDERECEGDDVRGRVAAGREVAAERGKEKDREREIERGTGTRRQRGPHSVIRSIADVIPTQPKPIQLNPVRPAVRSPPRRIRAIICSKCRRRRQRRWRRQQRRRRRWRRQQRWWRRRWHRSASYRSEAHPPSFAQTDRPAHPLLFDHPAQRGKGASPLVPLARRREAAA